jgi:hypothetical protein
MSIAYPRTTSARSIWAIDGAILIWAAAWIVVGVVVYHEVRGLAELSDTLESASEAIDETGRALGSLRELPLVGEDLGRLADRASATAASARASAQDSRERAERLSMLLGVSVAVAPTAPLLALYVPMRIARVREVRAVRRALRAGSGREFEELLAWRALQNLPYHRLRSASPHPRLDIETGRYDRLARAELARLGIGLRDRRAAKERMSPDDAPSDQSGDRTTVVPSSSPHDG